MQTAKRVLDFPFKKFGINFEESPLNGINRASKNLNGIFHIQIGLQTNQGSTLIFLKSILDNKNFKDLDV